METKTKESKIEKEKCDKCLIRPRGVLREQMNRSCAECVVGCGSDEPNRIESDSGRWLQLRCMLSSSGRDFPDGSQRITAVFCYTY